jgi:hypothetical protein
MGHFVNALLGAPLGPLLAECPAWSYAILTPELIGALVTLDAANEWIMRVATLLGESASIWKPCARGSWRIGTRQGMDLGYTYSSAAIVPDGSELPAVEDPIARLRSYS